MAPLTSVTMSLTTPAVPPGALAALTEPAHVARATPGLDLLLRFGSRARSDAHAGSDWDFGYLAAPEFDLPAPLAAAVETVGSDQGATITT